LRASLPEAASQAQSLPQAEWPLQALLQLSWDVVPADAVVPRV
jgi:hypothetical protein